MEVQNHKFFKIVNANFIDYLSCTHHMGLNSGNNYYFTTLKSLPIFYSQLPRDINQAYILEITLPKDAIVTYTQIGQDQMWHADKINVVNITTLRKFITIHPISLQGYNNHLIDLFPLIISINGLEIKYVKNQTPELCLEAVKNNGLAIEYIKNQTPDLCLEAVKRHGYAIQYIKNQTPELCLEAVKNNGLAIEYIENQTPELCQMAFDISYEVLPFLKHKTRQQIDYAIEQNALYRVYDI